MRNKRSRAWAAAVGMMLALSAVGLWQPALAQEGYPLKGSWIGTWKSNKANGESVFLVLHWDGKKISGMINPGTDDTQIMNASLDPQGWKVHLEAMGKGKSGKKLHYVIDGKIMHLELPNRSIVGTWKSEEGHGAFNVSRQ